MAKSELKVKTLRECRLKCHLPINYKLTNTTNYIYGNSVTYSAVIACHDVIIIIIIIYLIYISFFRTPKALYSEGGTSLTTTNV